MSPEATAADHVYRLLKADILGGRYAPSTVLNVHTIAIEIGTSISPVRDSMERLVGERILAVRLRGGFCMPQVTLQSAGDLYGWHSYLISGALRQRGPIGRVDDIRIWLDRTDPEDGESLVSTTAELFYRLGEAANSLEHLLAIRAAGERLHVLRLCEKQFANRKAELKKILEFALSNRPGELRALVTLYHRRRLRSLAKIVHSLCAPS